MEPRLRNLLREVNTEDPSVAHTHVSFYNPCGRWSIQSHNQTKFWNDYCAMVYERKTDPNTEIGQTICIAEKPADVMPVISKMTFKFQIDSESEQDDRWEPFGDDFLYHVVNIYQTVLLDNFRVNLEYYTELSAIILESETHWIEKGNDGSTYLVMQVRIHFPYAKVESSLQNRIIRPRVIQLLRNYNVMSRMQRQPIGDWEQIICPNVVNEPHPLYGCNDTPNQPMLEVTHIWQHIEREALEQDLVPREFTLQDAFIIGNHTHVQNGTVSSEIFKEEHPPEYWLPMFLSIGYWNNILLTKEPDNGRFQTQNRYAPRQPETNGPQQVDNFDDDDSELAERMLRMMNRKRFEKELHWLDIGKALYNSNEGNENGVLSWIKHTERATSGGRVFEFMLTAGNIAETCRNLYYTFENSPITVKTLAWYAREDSPDDYGLWHKDWCTKSMEDALSMTHTDVAIALHRVYWLDYVYCPMKPGKWFHFKNHRWTETVEAMSLRKSMSSDFMRKFEYVRMYLSRKIAESNDEGYKQNAEITLKKLSTLISKLKNVQFKSSIIREASEHFNHDSFIKLLDTNPDLTGVTNGVLEVCERTVSFRAAKPEDYISMCTNNPFRTSFTWSHPLVTELMTWFGQIFIERDLLHHFMKFASSCLKGKNSDKIFPIFTGEGNNSKSMLVKLFESAFSSYCIKFDTSNVTSRNQNSSGPSPQLARAKGTRIAFMDEPADDVPINKETIKRWIGGDSFYTRLLHDNGGDIAVLFKLVLTCNKVPIIPHADQAIKNRTRLFPFLSTWTQDASEDPAQQYHERKFKMDPFFERRIPILAPAFLWVMAQYYPYYYDERLEDPQIVKDTTEAYWRDNDVYAQFVADCVEDILTTDGKRDATSRVTLSELYNEFKTWYKDSFPGNKVPDRSTVRSEFSGRWGRMVGNSWHGFRMITTEEGVGDMTASLGGRSAVPPVTTKNITTVEQPRKLPDTPVIDRVPPSLIKVPGLDIISKEMVKSGTSDDDTLNYLSTETGKIVSEKVVKPVEEPEAQIATQEDKAQVAMRLIDQLGLGLPPSVAI